MPTPIDILLDPISLCLIGMFAGLMLWERLAPGRPLPKVRGWLPRALAGRHGLPDAVVLPAAAVGRDAGAAPAVRPVGAGPLPRLRSCGVLVYELLRLRLPPRDAHLHAAVAAAAPDAPQRRAARRGQRVLVQPARHGRLDAGDQPGLRRDRPAARRRPRRPSCSSASSAIFQHANVRTPRWLGYFVQRPESHSLHHERGVHRDNYSDLPVFDMLFGTFRNPRALRGRHRLLARRLVARGRHAAAARCVHPPGRPPLNQLLLKETHMNMIDSTGHPVSGATPESLAAYEQAARELLCMVDDPAASVGARHRRQPRDADGACAAGLAAPAGHRARRHCRGARRLRSRKRACRPTTASSATWPPPAPWPRAAGARPHCASKT